MSQVALVRDAENSPWSCSPASGVSYKSLRFEDETRAGAVLLHMCPGTAYPEHVAHRGVDIYVVDGDLAVGARRVARGGYAWLPPGSSLRPTTEGGCVLFVSFPGAVEHLHGDPFAQAGTGRA